MSTQSSQPDHHAWLSARLTHYLGGPVEDDVPFAEQCLDSAAALGLYGDIEHEYGPIIDPTDVWVYDTVQELAAYLELRDTRPGSERHVRAAFVFTGQGSQFAGMTAQLYLDSTVYRRHLDEVSAVLLPYLGLSVVDLVLSRDPRIHQTGCTQPALFAVEYALARTLQEAGVQPVAVLGHGIGEFAAATVADSLTLADAAKLVSLRGAFMQYLPSGGGMTATCATPAVAAEMVADEPLVGIGAINATHATVLSGDLAGLERVQDRLEQRGIACKRLQVSHAYHSPLMQPMLPKFEAAARRLPGGAPRLPYYSTVHGRLANQPLYAPYWSAQVTEPVRFADATRQLLNHQALTHVVEIGPKVVLTPFVRRMGGSGGPRCLPVCRGAEANAVDLAGVISALDAGPLAHPLVRA
jgi:[acyl-carrier-protein] S-malonyltransferase